MKKTFCLFFVFGLLHNQAAAQDTLPRFSVTNAGNNRVIVGWVNAIGPMRQISVQRSHDSSKNYKTIMSVADPNAVQNGFADTKAPNDHMWYRLFYVVGTGSYFFTAAKQPGRDAAATLENKLLDANAPKQENAAAIKNPGFVPSFYVYTTREGNVFINLPDADKKDYSLKFYDDTNTFLFDIKSIKETGLTVDKTNFYRAGWFQFELFNDEKLVERHRFQLSGH
jgi:hypothetical protein